MRQKRKCVYHAAMAIWLIACAASLAGCPSELATRLRYDVHINRHFDTLLERDLILVAENTYPDPEDVVELYPLGTNPEDLPENVWWYYGYFGSDTRYPYAITADAIEYYKQKVLEDRANAVPEPDLWEAHSEDFRYTATVKYFATFNGEEGETFSDVYVVTMSLNWRESCGPLCGGGFYQDREVVLTPSGEVLQVLGDGEAGQFYS
ncbi:MAG: hypothetical protein RBU21_17735 [FCB group bacterium]|nr:hypothetical protein [FCB group bacterium]